VWIRKTWCDTLTHIDSDYLYLSVWSVNDLCKGTSTLSPTTYDLLNNLYCVTTTMTHSTANVEDLDATLPKTRDVEPTDDDSVDAYETYVIYRDSLVDRSVCQQQSASTSGPPTLGPGPKTLRFNGSMQPGRSMEFNSETAGQAFPIGNSMDSYLAYADRVNGLPSGVQLAVGRAAKTDATLRNSVSRLTRVHV